MKQYSYIGSVCTGIFTGGLTEAGGTVTFDYNRMFSTVAANANGAIGSDYYGLILKNKRNNNAIGGIDIDGTATVHQATIFGGQHAGTYRGLIVEDDASLNKWSISLLPTSNGNLLSKNIGKADNKWSHLYCDNLSDGTTTKSMTTIVNSIPDAPTTDGNYVLRCAVVDGVATYSWEAE